MNDHQMNTPTNPLPSSRQKVSSILEALFQITLAYKTWIQSLRFELVHQEKEVQGLEIKRLPPDHHGPGAAPQGVIINPYCNEGRQQPPMSVVPVFCSFRHDWFMLSSKAGLACIFV